MVVFAVLTRKVPTSYRGVAVREKCEAVTSTYETFRSDDTVTVEHEPDGISLDVPGTGDGRVTAHPTSMDPDDHECYFLRGTVRVHVKLDLRGDEADLFVFRHRYRRQKPGEIVQIDATLMVN